MSESQGSIRVVLDTNVLLRALARPFSKSAQLVRACEERRAIAILSKPVIDEYRHVLTVVGIGHNEITSTSIELVMRRLRYFGEYQRHILSKFPYPRDPTDSKLIELAIESRATHIASYDLDFLSLPKSRDEAGKRFRRRAREVRIMTPNHLLRDHPHLAVEPDED